jgi:hypothetical protein
MNFYEVGYTTWEECPQIILSHEDVYTQDEFNEILLDAYVEVNKKEEANHNEWYLNEWQSEENKEKREELGEDWYAYRPRVSSLYSGVLNYLVDKKGFKNLDIIASFSPSDNSDLVPRKGEEIEEIGDMEYVDDALVLLRQRFNTIEPRDKKIDDILKK